MNTKKIRNCKFEGKIESHPFCDAFHSSVTVQVHLDRLRHNHRELHRIYRVPVMPVLKADAYGHGVLECALALEKESPLLGVGTVAEGAALRDAGVAAPILAMVGLVCPEDVPLAVKSRIMPLVGTFEGLKALAHANAVSTPLPVALKFNTGMSRLGFSLEDVPALIDLLKSTPQIVPETTISHLATADEPDKEVFTGMQTALFADIVAALRPVFPNMRFSLANSAGGLAYQETRHDFVREGIALYGCNPLAGTGFAQILPALQPVMEAYAPILQIRELAVGETVSYGCTFTAPIPMRIAVVAAGYAHGFLRALSGRGMLNIKGARAPILGRVCMQLCMVDISQIPDVRPGDLAFIIGGEQNPILAEEQAAWAGTIPYEFFCLLGSMNQRHYI